VLGQQLPQYSQWAFNQFSLNPAMAGIKNCLDVRTAVRLQYLGIDGAPQSGLFTINAPINTRRKDLSSPYHGLGAKIERDVIGNFTDFAVSIAYALHFPIDRNKRLSFGLSGGVQQFSFNQENVITVDPDPSVTQSANVFMVPLLGGGAWYNSNNFYVGLSFDQLARNQWRDIGLASRFGIHSKIVAGTRWGFDNGYSLLPSALLRIPPAGPVSLDLNMMMDFKNNFLFGFGFRNTDAIIALFRLRFDKFSVGYSFDFITSNLQGGNFNTHEISILFNNCRNRNSKADACPLFE
jgi:type IX secretion system PorP/SprF family membrane protein